MLALILACGCGQAARADGPSCSLITQAQAEVIFGGRLAPGRASLIEAVATGSPLIQMVPLGRNSSDGVGEDCYFETAADDNAPGDVELSVMDLAKLGVLQPPPTFFEGLMKQASENAPVTMVAGVGQEAYFTQRDSEFSVLYGSKILSFDAPGSRNPDVRDAILAAARRILQKT